MTLIIVAILVGSYVMMTLSQVTHINRAAVAMFCGVIVWSVYALMGGHIEPQTVMNKYVWEACGVVFFLIATNTIVEILHNNGVFDSLRGWLRMRSSRRFLWAITLLTYFLSANVDNLTTVVLMIGLMSRIVGNRKQKMIYGCAILVAASMGGAFTVVGDMTSLMLWVHGVVTASGLAAGLFLPTFATLCVFNLLLSPLLQGKLDLHSVLHHFRGDDSILQPWQKIVLLVLGIGGIWAIPTFSAHTHFPPFIGALCALSLVWVVEGLFTFRANGNRLFVQRDYLSNTEFIGIQTILYYLGIALGVGALNQCGALSAVSSWLSQYVHNVYAFGAFAGVLGGVVDNVPLVMSGMNMFSLDSGADFGLNGAYWQLLSYCSAVGGCILFVSTLAGHAATEVENVSLRWYVRNILWRVLIAWGVGMGVFWLIH